MNPIQASIVTGTAAPAMAPPPAETPVGFASVLGLVLKPVPSADGRSAADPGSTAELAPAQLTTTADSDTSLAAGASALPDPDVNGTQVSVPAPMALLHQLRGLRAAQEAGAAAEISASADEGETAPAAASLQVLPSLPVEPATPEPAAAATTALADGESGIAPAVASLKMLPQLAGASAERKPSAAPQASDGAAVSLPASDNKQAEGDPARSSTAPEASADPATSGDVPLNADPAASASAVAGADPLALGPAVVVQSSAAPAAAAAPGVQSPSPGRRLAVTLQGAAAGPAQAVSNAAEPAGADETSDARNAEAGSAQASGLVVKPGETDASPAFAPPSSPEGKDQIPLAGHSGKALDMPVTSAGDFNPSALNHLLGHATHSAAGPTAGDAASANPPTLSTPVPVDADLPEALGERVLMLSEAGVSSARIELHPAELGSLVVRIEVHQDQAQVAFSADNPATRSLLQQAMPQLRELFGAQGLQLLRTRVEERQRDTGSNGGGFAQTRTRGELPAVRRIGRIRLVDAYV